MSIVAAQPALQGPTQPPGYLATPAVRASRRRALCLALLPLLAYSLIALALFPSVVAHLATAFPSDLGDPPSQAWILAWDVHALTTNPTHLYQANTFYPTHDVLAYQDTGLSLLPVAAPLLLLSGNAVLAYNVLFLLTFALCAWGAYLLARLLVGDARAAFLAGLVYGFSAYRMVHLSHLNLLSGFWIPFVLLCWERARRGESRWWIGAGVFYVLQALSALYYAAYLVVALLVLACVHVRHTRRARVAGTAVAPLRPFIRGAALTAACCALVLWPLLAPYLRVEHATGNGAGLAQSIHFAADLRDFLHSSDLSVFYGWTGHALGVRATDSLQYLWPGAVALLLALWGLTRRSQGYSGRFPDAWRAYALLLVVAAVFCLGPFLKVWGGQTSLPLPYLLLAPLPGFAGLRDPARFGAIYTLCLAVLVAYGAAALLATRWPWRGRRGAGSAALLCIGVLAEAWIRPLPVAPIATGAQVPPVYRWLATQPAGRPVLELPIGLQNRTIWAEQTVDTYYSTYHWHPVVNGMGRFDPPGYDQDVPVYNSFPAAAALRLLRAERVYYVIVHRAWVGLRRANAIRSEAAHTPGLRLVRHWTGIDVYVIARNQ